MDGLMHYSPFAAGTGLFVVWYVAPAGSPPALVARFLIDCAGLVFVAILAFFLLTNLMARSVPCSRAPGAPPDATSSSAAA